MTAQIAVKLPDEMLAAVDRLVDESHFESRSDVVRRALQRIIDEASSRAIDTAFEHGFARHPETADEMRRATRRAIASIDDEPWEKWW